MAWRAGTSGVSADDAQVQDEVVAEEAFYDGLEAQHVESDKDEVRRPHERVPRHHRR